MGPEDEPIPISERYSFGFGTDAPNREWDGVPSPLNDQWKVRRGVDVVLAAQGFTYPVNIAFPANPSDSLDAPLYYVNELHGTVKYVTKTGEIQSV